jgi:peptide subunit release factor 1 (eRF1)
MLDSNARIELTCPNAECGNKWSVRLGEMRRGPITCPECGLEMDTTEFDKGMADVEKKLKQFGRRLR